MTKRDLSQFLVVVTVVVETHIILHAPHPPSAHPSLEPFRPISSRRKDRRVWLDLTFVALSSGTLDPLTYRMGVVRYPSVENWKRINTQIQICQIEIQVRLEKDCCQWQRKNESSSAISYLVFRRCEPARCRHSHRAGSVAYWEPWCRRNLRFGYASNLKTADKIGMYDVNCSVEGS